MKPDRKKQKRLDTSTRLNLAVVAAFTALILWGIFLVRDKMLQNAQELLWRKAMRRRSRAGFRCTGC